MTRVGKPVTKSLSKPVTKSVMPAPTVIAKAPKVVSKAAPKPTGCGCPKPTITCTNRFSPTGETKSMRTLLANLQNPTTPYVPPAVNAEETKYAAYNYNGQFHKTLNHNTGDGRLVTNSDYTTMRDSIRTNNQVALAAVPLAIGSEVKLIGPLSANSIPLIGAPYGLLTIDTPPALSSKAGAAEMVEVYAMALARDVGFIDYGTNGLIASLLGVTRLNEPELLANLPYGPSVTLDAAHIFRGNCYNEDVGPLVSQLLWLKVPVGALTIVQLLNVPKTKALAAGRVEWGVNRTETIDLQNGHVSSVPVFNPADLELKYIYSGRSMAEAFHNDSLYSWYHNATLQLLALGCPVNPGFPTYPNQAPFPTCAGPVAIMSAIGDITAIALHHAWFWKWRAFRKLRPEVWALWVEDVKKNLVLNTGNFDIDDLLFNNDILADIYTASGLETSYTLPMAYREASPAHPTYPSGHAVISGACATVLKIFFDAERPWNGLPGVIAGSLAPVTGSVVANATGSALVAYTGVDEPAMTVTGEINKLASNDAMGRCWAGVHYRADGMQGLALGEQIAIHYMRDVLASFAENKLNGTTANPTFRKFDGTFYTVRPTMC